MGQLVEVGVQRLKVEQAQLVGGGGFQRESPVATGQVHGSVLIRETPTVAPRQSQPRSAARPGGRNWDRTSDRWFVRPVLYR